MTDPVTLQGRLINLQANLLDMAATAQGLESVDLMDEEARGEVLLAATEISSLFARKLDGEDVLQEIKHVRARMLLWSWVGAREVRIAWQSFLRGVTSAIAAGVATGFHAAVVGLFA